MPAVGSEFTLISSNAPVNGAFAGLPSGSFITVGTAVEGARRNDVRDGAIL
jgi:hypothetical protein